MRRLGSWLVWMATASAIFALAGCATPYQPYGMGGGYRERPVGPNRYYVEFYGNGNTNRDTVVAFWLHRCAEFTSQKGFKYFAVVSKNPPPSQSMSEPGSGIAAVAIGDGSDETLYVPARGGGGYTYTPGYGGTVTTWSMRAVIELRNGTPADDGKVAFEAKTVLSKLGPAVRQANSAGKNIVLPKEFAQVEPDAPSDEGRGVGVKLDDLDSLLPKE